MCGIVGYIGNAKAQDILIEGLSKLEYRGYDSSGIAVLDDTHSINVQKKKGRIRNLEKLLFENPLTGHVGIGHTRWATHGAPSDINSHPQCSTDGRFAVVHNGIIENYMELKESLINQGYLFKSDTDTEVIAQLIGSLYDGEFKSTVYKAVKQLKGSYALGILCADNPDEIIAVRKDSPLIIGVGENENFIASDVPAILAHTRDVCFLDNGEVAVLKKNEVKVYDKYGDLSGKQIFRVTWDPGDAEKGGYEHFMLKEIYEQPKAIRDTLMARLFEDHIELDNINLAKEDVKKINQIQIVSCGTAYHAGLVGKRYLEMFAHLSVEAETASEYRYKTPIVDKHTLLIVISQSGETADTLAAIRLAKDKGARVIAITNVVGSSIARESDDVLYTNAGPEIAVASTKAYVTQVCCMLMLAMHIGTLNGSLEKETFKSIKVGMDSLVDSVTEVLKFDSQISEIAYDHFNIDDAYFIGRGLDFCTCMEGSLKMKEISYIHSEAFSAGELKHGPIALLENGSLVIALCTQENTFEKMLSNIKEVKARGAYVLAITQAHRDAIAPEVDRLISIPDIPDELAPITSIVLLQMLAYYLAVARGCDVDKPKNLAKAVTVE